MKDMLLMKRTNLCFHLYDIFSVVKHRQKIEWGLPRVGRKGKNFAINGDKAL